MKWEYAQLFRARTLKTSVDGVGNESTCFNTVAYILQEGHGSQLFAYRKGLVAVLNDLGSQDWEIESERDYTEVGRWSQANHWLSKISAIDHSEVVGVEGYWVHFMRRARG